MYLKTTEQSYPERWNSTDETNVAEARPCIRTDQTREGGDDNVLQRTKVLLTTKPFLLAVRPTRERLALLRERRDHRKKEQGRDPDRRIPPLLTPQLLTPYQN